MEKIIEKIKSKKTAAILKIQTQVIKSIHDYMHEQGVVQLMPVMLSPITDPLAHSVHDAEIDYEGQKLKLTKSMILHKHMALMSEEISKIFIMSPNVRLEKDEVVGSKRHLIEFSQLDIEFKGMKKDDFMKFMESLVVKILSDVKEKCSKELDYLGRKITLPKIPFARYESKELLKKYGKDYEKMVSTKAKDPFWILDLKREFYDREDEKKKDYYHNYDLVWPEGFGEALSGGEREHLHDVMLRKMRERDQDPVAFSSYLELAKRKELSPSCGGGLGIERTVRFISGVSEIKDVALFSRSPGEKIIV